MTILPEFPSQSAGEATRIEQDSMGGLAVPQSALYGAQTQRAINNFPISGQPLPNEFIQAIARIKWAAAIVNHRLGLLDAMRAKQICAAAQRIVQGELAEQFPIDIFQTGSGTSTNMNVNEVIAHLASTSALAVDANDHVNMSQSSNDTIPSAIYIAAALAIQRRLLPALKLFQQQIFAKSQQLVTVVKTGRTHLMDAMPVRLSQEMSGWQAQMAQAEQRINDGLIRLLKIAQGGTAVGTGVNAHPLFAAQVAAELAQQTQLSFIPSDNFFAALSAPDSAVEMSGHLKTLACALIKICNDLRWMNSGPLAGLNEIELPALQPGSSIMPAKVNPVIPEACLQVAAQVMGNDTAITLAGQAGNFQLNVMLPLIAANLLQSIKLLTNVLPLLANCISGFKVRNEQIAAPLSKNPILITALNPIIGYERAAQIAKKAYCQQRPILEVAEEETSLKREELMQLLDPQRLTQGG